MIYRYKSPAQGIHTVQQIFVELNKNNKNRNFDLKKLTIKGYKK